MSDYGARKAVTCGAPSQGFEQSSLMFRHLGNAVSRAWPILLVAWIILLIGTSLVAPAWDKIVKDGQFAFLPSDAPSRRGERLFKEAFPDEYFGSSIVLVLSREA